ncbi:MAG: patatin-like phospholipase family protein [Gemmatimonadota bacterium]
MPVNVRRPTPATADLAMVLGGGGARGAYQVGLLRGIASRYPNLRVPILVGVSAGAINTVHIAAHRGSFRDAMDSLVALWLTLTPETVFQIDARSLLSNVVTSGARLVSGDSGSDKRVRGMVDTTPLRHFLERSLERAEDGSLPGIRHNLELGKINAVALSATSYTTGQSVTWVQGRNITTWERPRRRSVNVSLEVEHVMASSALPLFFPAVRVGDEWFGDGGVRLTAPLSPALHLGASRVITISTRHPATTVEASAPQLTGYPPPAQVLGVLYDAVFLDVIDQDVSRLKRLNSVISKLPPDKRDGLRLIDILVLRPSQDLARLSGEYEPRLPKVFRFLTRGLGTRATSRPHILSLIMFQEDYLQRLIALGEEDAERQSETIAQFLER